MRRKDLQQKSSLTFVRIRFSKNGVCSYCLFLLRLITMPLHIFFIIIMRSITFIFSAFVTVLPYLPELNIEPPTISTSN